MEKLYKERRMWFYARCSTKEQNLDRQIMLFKEKYGAKDEQIICEKISGKVKANDRTAYTYLVNVLARKGDIVVFDSINRLGRDYKDILNSWTELNKLGIYVVIDDMPLLDTRPKGDLIQDELLQNLIINLVTNFLAFAAQREIEEKKRAQLAGIEAARKAHKNLGRPKFVIPDDFDDIYAEWRKGLITATNAMRKLNMSHSTFYRTVNKYEKRKM